MRTSSLQTSQKVPIKQPKFGTPFHLKSVPTKLSDNYTPTERRLAQQVCRIYTEMKRRWTGDPFRRTMDIRNVHYEQFKKTARRILEYKARHHPVNPAVFVGVVFSYFGTSTYPAHLNSDKIWSLYFKWEARRQSATQHGVEFSVEEDTLQHLCASRGESLKSVWPKVKSSGVFTDAFVEYMDEFLAHQ